MKRIILWVICIAMVCCMVTGCEQKKDNKDDNSVIDSTVDYTNNGIDSNKETVIDDNSKELITVWLTSYWSNYSCKATLISSEHGVDQANYEIPDGTYRLTYNYNEKGYVTEEKYGITGQEDTYCAFSYEYGEKSVTAYMEGDKYQVYKFDEDGRLCSIEYNEFVEHPDTNKREEKIYTAELKYNNEGNLVRVNQYEMDTLLSETEYFYDDEGRRIREEEYQNSRLEEEILYEYDGQDRIVKEIVRRRGKSMFATDITTGESVEIEGTWGTQTFIYNFNDEAGIMELKMYDSDDELMKGKYVFEKIEVTPEEYEVLRINIIQTINPELYLYYEEQGGLYL